MLVESFSGVRGVFGDELDCDTARCYAKSFSDFLISKKKGVKPLVVMGTDSRPSCDVLKKCMIEVFIQKCDVIDVGVNSTPAIEFAVRKFKAAGGVIITASHNEPKFNGWKLLRSDGCVLSPKDMVKVIEKCKKAKPFSSKKFVGNVCSVDVSDDYINFVLDIVGKDNVDLIKKSNFKVVVDPNGGSAVVFIKKILEKCNIQVVEMNNVLGKFNRKIEPTADSLTKMVDVVKKEKADLGAGFDCDADRVELVDEEGDMLSGQYVLALLVKEVLSSYKGKDKVVVTNDATSGVVKFVADEFGAKVVEVEVGEVNVVDKMIKLNSLVGGEGSSSGGIFPPSKCRDGCLTLLMILRFMAKHKKSLSKLYFKLPRYYTPREMLSCDPKHQLKIRSLIEKKFRKKGFKIIKTGDQTGGLKIIIDKSSWLWFRVSKTEAGSFRIIADSTNYEKSKKLLSMGVDIFKECVPK